MLGNPDHAEVGSESLLNSSGEVEWPGDEVVALLVEVLVEDDVVHGLREVSIDFVQKRGRVCGTLASEGLRVLGHR